MFGTPAVEATAPAHLRLDIQGLRAIAVLLVVVFHAGLPLPGGFVGVDVFFVISGFVITSLLLRELEASGRISLRRFYRRRVRRLLPALALVVTATVLAATVLQSAVSVLAGQRLTAVTGLGALFFVANVVLYRVPVDGYFADDATDNPLLHTWSLSVEEQFYVIFPLLLLLTWGFAVKRSRRRRRALLLVTSVVGVASFAACVVFSYALVALPAVSAPGAFAFYMPVTRAWEFAAGAIVAIAAPFLLRLPRALFPVAGALGLAGIAAAALLLSEGEVFPGVTAVLPVTGAVLVIVAGTGGASHATTRWLSTKPMTAIGDVSYGFYLWHWPCIVLAPILLPQVEQAPLIGALVSVVPTVLSYRYVENPIRHGAPIGRLSTPRVAMASLAVPAAACLVLALGATVGWGQSVTRDLRSTLAVETVGTVSDCLLTSEASPEVFERCRWPVDDSRGTVLLAGDSHADSLSDAVIAAGNAMGFDVVLANGANCAFAEPVDGLERVVPNCAELSEWRADFAISNDVDLVVTSQYTQEHVAGLKGLSGESAREAWVEANVGMLERLEREGIPVLLVGDVPTVGVNGSPCWYGAVAGPRCSTSQSLVDSRQLDGLVVEAAIAERLGNVSYWTPFHWLCDGESCTSAEGGSMLYRDREHLTAFGSEQLRPEMQRQMEDALERETTRASGLRDGS